MDQDKDIIQILKRIKNMGYDYKTLNISNNKIKLILFEKPYEKDDKGIKYQFYSKFDAIKKLNSIFDDEIKKSINYNYRIKSIPLKKRLYKYILYYNNVTFIELHLKFGNEFIGNFDWVYENLNVIFWSGMNKTFLYYLELLIKEKLIYIHLADQTVYVFDGKIPALPIATKLESRYKRTHWLPIVLSTKKSKISVKFINQPTKYQFLGENSFFEE